MDYIAFGEFVERLRDYLQGNAYCDDDAKKLLVQLEHFLINKGK